MKDEHPHPTKLSDAELKLIQRLRERPEQPYTNQIGMTNFFAYDEGKRKIFETNANSELIRYMLHTFFPS